MNDVTSQGMASRRKSSAGWALLAEPAHPYKALGVRAEAGGPCSVYTHTGLGIIVRAVKLAVIGSCNNCFQ